MIDSICEYWTLYLNLFGMSVCFITMVCLAIKILHQSKKQRRKSFEEEVITRIMKQHVEHSFKNITQTINKERRALWSLFDKVNLDQTEKMLQNNNTRVAEKRREIRDPEKYSEILRLAEDGMGTKKISETVRMPKGEVDLVIALKKNFNDADPMDMPRIKAFS